MLISRSINQIMPRIARLLFLCLVVASCSRNKTTPAGGQLSDAEKIANAYGIANFNRLQKLTYTFNVQRDTTHSWRTWVWQKKAGKVTMITGQDTTRYNLSTVNESLKTVDHRFINDKYWLLFPFQLVWDDNLTITNHGAQTAPISGKQLTKITAQYGPAGGYTPGDAYDLYVDEAWLIREWVFRKSGQKDPSLATTWEDYADKKEVKIATNHYNKDRSFRLYFTDIVFE